MSTSVPFPTPTSTPTTFTNPVLDQDFPDPDVLQVGDMYYAYATNANDINIQAARSTDLVHWDVLEDALPELPAWAVQSFGSVWAPEVFRPGEGQYVMYFTARFAIGFDGVQCIGVATGNDPADPFVSSNPEPFICQTDQGGSIDPSAFVDADGRRYVLWKNDGNSRGGQTWLYIQPVSADGLTLQGEPRQLLTADQRWEGILVEAPTLWRQDGKYYLFYSANAYNDRRYATGYAVADNIFGPYVKAEEPLIATDLAAGLVGPGGQDVVTDDDGETWIMFHGWAPDGYRRLYLAPLAWHNGLPTLELNGRDPLPMP
ncbi:MAG TPA: glycoside hydrolase family 43 protein [Anaerolineales bacterium]|nr:glycoside hydrolase family 43 protein [Anaerolineales bacterium]